MKNEIRRIVFWSGRIIFLLRRFIAFARLSRKINKLKKKKDKLIAESIRLRTAQFQNEIVDLDKQIAEQSKAFLKWFRINQRLK